MTLKLDELEYVTVREAASIVRVSEISIRRLLTQGKLIRYKFGARTLIKRAELLSLVKTVEAKHSAEIIQVTMTMPTIKR